MYVTIGLASNRSSGDSLIRTYHWVKSAQSLLCWLIWSHAAFLILGQYFFVGIYPEQ